MKLSPALNKTLTLIFGFAMTLKMTNTNTQIQSQTQIQIQMTKKWHLTSDFYGESSDETLTSSE